MLDEIMNTGREVKICTSGAESRGMKEPMKGALLGTLTDLTKAIVECEKVLTF
jgi:sulfur relay (sulfurtransferase) complex TusBCD TusD component (DsrE family)